MRHLASSLALAACVVLVGAAADASPTRRAGHHRKAGKLARAKKAKHRAKVAPPVEPEVAILDDEREPEPDHERAPELELDVDTIADVAAPARVHARHRARARDWSVAVGPYLWATAVDATVSLGPASVGAGVDFIDLQRHARYGAEMLAEARLGRFSLATDFMYGVVGVNGQREVGPLMVTVEGTASSLLVDGAAGYLLTGGEHALVSVEARAGIRYQRTAVTGSVAVGGTTVAPPTSVDSASDALAGGRVILRPSRRYFLSTTFDHGVAGKSTNTWSAAADASLRLGSHVLLSLGWRTLTTERANISIVMHGPRAAVQLVF